MARPRGAQAPKAPVQTQRAARPAWLPAATLAAIAIAMYANSLANGFIGDDHFQLLRNPLVKDLGAIPKFFGAGVWSFLGVAANYYRPLPFIVYCLIYQIAGFQAWAFHLLMVLLHAVNTLLLYRFVQRMTATRIAWAAAALFAVHPVHTEAVDWIASLPDLLLTLWGLAGVVLFARQNGKPRGAQVAVHCAIYLLALWTKETGVALIALYFGFGFFCLGRRWSEFRANATLYAAMAFTFALYLVMRVAALGSFAPRKHDFFHLTPLEFTLSIIVTAGQYLRMLIAPLDLNYFHVFHPTQGMTAALLLSLVALACAAALFARSRSALVAYGLVWMAAAIAPALDLTAVGQNVFTERYLYLPSAAFCWIAAWGWNWCAERYRGWPKPLAIALLVLCAGVTAARNRDWRDDFTLLLKTERQSPDSGWVHDALAGEYVQRGMVADALRQEQFAARYDPGMALYHKKLGYILMGSDPRAAIAEFQEVDRLEPGAAANYYDLGTAYEAAGDPLSASREYAHALAIQPNYPEARQAYDRVSRLPR